MKKMVVWFGVLAAFVLIAGCNPSSDSPPGANDSYTRCLYITDTNSGEVFTYDPVSRSPSAMSLASTGQDSTGEIAFYEGIGYACVGYGTNAGVYYFDPSAANPAFTKIAGTVCAAYCAFASDTKAYVSVYDYYDTSSGIHTFNPSAPAEGISSSPLSNTEGDDFQEMVIAPDGYLYAANNTDGTVIKIDTATDTIVATIHATAAGTTGLFAGAYNGSAGVFVANTGGYDPSTYAPLPGSLDFIAQGSTSAIRVVNPLPDDNPIYPARLVQLANGNLIATGSVSSYLVYLSSSAIDELNHSGSSFGGLDIAYKDGLVYIPVTVTSDYITYSNYLYVLGEDGSVQSFSPVSVMGSSESITNIAFYED